MTHRRGIALLMVLGVLIMVMGSLMMIVRLTTTIHCARQAGDGSAIADDLLIQSESIAQRWLFTSDSIVLPPDARVPSVAVLNHRWASDETRYSIAISAFDQCGMVPATSTSAISGLQATLPSAVLRRLESHVIQRGAIVGLDLFQSPSGAEGHERVYPAAMVGPSQDFGGSLPQRFDPVQPRDAEGDQHSDPAFGALVATHNPSPGSTINVNTAPRELVAAALRAKRRGGIELILAARAKGESASLEVSSSSGQGRRSRGLTLVTKSASWAFRIDIQVGSVTRSWWSVFSLNADQEQWNLVQRLAITE